MAEPFSIATGALQVAGAGLQLAKTLYEFTDCVKTAPKHVNAIAVEVKLTSSVLQHLGTLLKDHEGEKLCSSAIISDAGTAFKGCEDAFREIDEAFRPLLKQQTNGSRGLSVSGRWAWPFKKGKLETLQANLERLKTTLLLMLSVVSYAREKGSKSAATAVDCTVEKLQMLNLMKAKEDATERYEKLVIELSRLDTHSTVSTESRQPSIGAASASNIPTVGQPFINLHTNNAQTTSSASQPSTDNIQKALVMCACVASQLSHAINKASADWTFGQVLNTRPVRTHWAALEPLVKQVLIYDQSRRWSQSQSHVQGRTDLQASSTSTTQVVLPIGSQQREMPHALLQRAQALGQAQKQAQRVQRGQSRSAAPAPMQNAQLRQNPHAQPVDLTLSAQREQQQQSLQGSPQKQRSPQYASQMHEEDIFAGLDMDMDIPHDFDSIGSNPGAPVLRTDSRNIPLPTQDRMMEGGGRDGLPPPSLPTGPSHSQPLGVTKPLGMQVFNMESKKSPPCSRCRTRGVECDRRLPICSPCTREGITEGECARMSPIDADLDDLFGVSEVAAEVEDTLQDSEWEKYLFGESPDASGSETAHPRRPSQVVRRPEHIGHADIPAMHQPSQPSEKRARFEADLDHAPLTPSASVSQSGCEKDPSLRAVRPPRIADGNFAQSAVSPHGVPVYESGSDAVTPDKLKCPPLKKRKLQKEKSDGRAHGETGKDVKNEERAEEIERQRKIERQRESNRNQPGLDGYAVASAAQHATPAPAGKADVWNLDSVDDLVRRWTTVAV